jgi:sugar O-acyltransferase (sialic acid O-acetyltransferase NeuD family)
LALRRIEVSVDEIIVVGGGGHAKVVISILKKLNRYSLLGYTDVTNRGAVLGVPHLGSDDELAARAADSKKICVALGVGQVGLGNKRYDIWTRLNLLSLPFPAIVSPKAVVNEEASCGDGSVVMDGTVINTGAIIGRCAIVNTNSTVEHDVRIEDWVHVAPGATICGDVTVGRFSMIGAGATVKEGIKISESCIVGAGATVVSNLNEPGTYIGCPARRIK